MNEYKIVIDPGHGGLDPGASGNGIIEKDLALKISKELYRYFQELGISVFLTRDGDQTLDPTDRVNLIKKPFGNSDKVIVLSNHINAGGGDGAEVIYALRNTDKLSNLILEELEKKGQNKRKSYQRRLPSDPSLDYYFIHRDTKNTEPVIIEYGFLDSTGDDIYQLKNNYKEFANAVGDAVLKYIGYDKNLYIVKDGDTLWSISEKFNITVDQIKLLNNLSNNNLVIGQKIKLPTNNIDNNNIETYTVKNGDTLYSIANKYNILIEDIINNNNLVNSNLSIGQILRIPKKEETNNQQIYTVKSGDSLYSISKKFNTTIDSIVKLNNLTNNLLSIGQKIKLPNSTDSEEIYVTYIIKQGDSLYAIANKFNTTVENIKKSNSLFNNLINVGQKLLIPVNNIYIVKAGDTLSSIASLFNLTVNDLKKKNDLIDDKLFINQTLNI